MINKIYELLGYNNLALIMDQERKHWLMKTDKRKHIQDKVTGDLFEGIIDNTGSNIIVETQKSGGVTGANMIKYVDDRINDVLSIEPSAFTYNTSVNGLMYACVNASKIAYQMNGDIQYKNYKLKLSGCEEVIIPFGNSFDSNGVYATKWLKTNTLPVIMIVGNDNLFSIELSAAFKTDITNCTYYYPLDESLQPFGITKEAYGVYTLDAVTDDSSIGLPLYWFTCDNTNVGPTISFENNLSVKKSQLLHISNPGNSNKYHAEIYCNIDGNVDATPDDTSTSNWSIKCTTLNGLFTNTVSDENVLIDTHSISFVNNTDDTTHVVDIVSEYNNKLTLLNLDKWVRSGDTATIQLSEFDTNCLSVNPNKPLIPMFKLILDESIPFLGNSTDVGYAGLQLNSSNPSSDNTTRYPYDLCDWDGIPEWIKNHESGVPQYSMIYAIHNTPSYTSTIPDSRQVAALLLDPGKPKTSDEEEFSNDERGRIYYLSNDPAIYENNATTDNPKPPRTLARICDIPTSILQLTNITGLSPTTVVDKDYVHTDASYSESDRNRLYNILSSKWVRPNALDSDGNKISDKYENSNDFIFSSIVDLNSVDLVNHNDFRRYINLNPSVDAHKVSVGLIYSPGSLYKPGDIGTVIVGGFAFNYTVESATDIDESNQTGGAVTKVVISPSHDYNINLSNFNMNSDGSGSTDPYGTSPLGDSTGTGLRFNLIIEDYESLVTRKGSIFDDLFALVKTSNGIWIYSYIIENNTTDTIVQGEWKKQVMISESEASTSVKSNGGLSVTESYINSIIPSLKTLPISYQENNQPFTTIETFATPNFVNIIDENATPVVPAIDSMNKETRKRVDMTKLYCSGIRKGISTHHTDSSILSFLESNNVLMFDSYLFWKWDDPNDTTNNKFTYGVVYRSFNNLLSTDTITTLPINELNCDNFVHSNQSSTVVWNVKDVGTMLCIYNQTYNTREVYTIDADTRDITIDRTRLTWKDVDFRANSRLSLIDKDGKMLYNIYTNNPIQSSYELKEEDPIYQQPNFTKIVSIGESFDELSDKQQPIGMWQLVFPRVNTFRLSNISNGLTFDAVKMDIIRGSNLGKIGNVTNENDDIVNNKTLILDNSSSGNQLKAYNSETNSWDII